MRSCLMLLTAVLFIAAPAAAQISIGPNGMRSGSTVIDSGGVHTDTADVTSRGVRTHGSSLGGTTILTNGNTRSIDCGGRALTVSGNSNHLTATRCSAIVVNGNGNELRADFPVDGRLSLMGNHNRVSWHAEPKVRVGVSNLGTRNNIARL